MITHHLYMHDHGKCLQLNVRRHLFSNLVQVKMWSSYIAILHCLLHKWVREILIFASLLLYFLLHEPYSWELCLWRQMMIWGVWYSNWHSVIRPCDPSHCGNKRGNGEEDWIRLYCTTGLQSFLYTICLAVSYPLVQTNCRLNTTVGGQPAPPKPSQAAVHFKQATFLNVLCKIRSSLP